MPKAAIVVGAVPAIPTIMAIVAVRVVALAAVVADPAPGLVADDEGLGLGERWAVVVRAVLGVAVALEVELVAVAAVVGLARLVPLLGGRVEARQLFVDALVVLVHEVELARGGGVLLGGDVDFGVGHGAGLAHDRPGGGFGGSGCAAVDVDGRLAVYGRQGCRHRCGSRTGSCGVRSRWWAWLGSRLGHSRCHLSLWEGLRSKDGKFGKGKLQLFEPGQGRYSLHERHTLGAERVIAQRLKGLDVTGVVAGAKKHVLALFDAAQETSHLLALAVGPLVALTDVNDREKGLRVVEAMDKVGELTLAVYDADLDKLRSQSGYTHGDLDEDAPVVDV